jgi:hypothetical protein
MYCSNYRQLGSAESKMGAGKLPIFFSIAAIKHSPREDEDSIVGKFLKVKREKLMSLIVPKSKR